MTATLIIACVLFSGSFLGAAVWRRQAEEILPVTLMGIVVILFGCGFFGILRYGLWVVLLASAAVYLVAALWIIRKKHVKEVLSHFVTPGAVLFLLLLALLSFADAGKLASKWDEFSHWMDSVKVMTALDDFVTNPASHSQFKSYPPAMSLFQYFAVKVQTWLWPGEIFSEWRVYWAYQVFALSLFIPFFKNASFKRPVRWLLGGLLLFLTPLVCYPDFYTTVYIDAFLGLLTGAGFGMILFCDKKDGLYTAYIALICVTLVLAKEAGMYFALFLAGAFALDRVTAYRRSSPRKWVKLPLSLLPFVGLAVAKAGWQYVITSSGVTNTSVEKVDFLHYLRMVFLGGDGTYRQTVVDNFKGALREPAVALGRTGIKLSWIALLILSAAGLYLLYRRLRKYDADTGDARFQYILLGVQAVCYLFFLGGIYVYNFTQYEAVHLASLERYAGMPLLAMESGLTAGLILLLIRYTPRSRMTAIAVACAAAVWLFAPKAFLLRQSVEASAAIRDRYQALNEQIQRNCDEKDKIYFISQENNGFDYWAVRFAARPAWVQVDFGGWSLGEPFYEGDVWTQSLPAKQWGDLLEKGGYGYVALYRVNDYFMEQYAPLFADPAQITENTLYRFDSRSRQLERCGADES